MSPARPTVAVIDAAGRDLPGLDAIAEVVDVVIVEAVDALTPRLPEVEAILAWRFDRAALLDAIADAPRLRWVQSSSAGVEDLAAPVLRERGIVLTNAAGIFDRALAESVLGFLLAFSARILECARAEPGEWRDHTVRPLRGTVALVVGAGSIGTETGRLLAAAGLRVRGLARTPRPAAAPFEHVAGPDDLLAELALADHVVNVLPITPRTARFFGAQAFAAMRPSAVFVNIGRGATVDEPAMVEALGAGRIAGAALDVFEVEPLPADSPLWTMPNVLVSPHRAGNQEGWEADVARLCVDNLRRFVAGEPLRNVVDIGLGYAPGGRS